MHRNSIQRCTYKCLLDTGSAINMINESIFCVPIQNSRCEDVKTNGPITLNNRNSILKKKTEPFYVHRFSNNNDMLIGKKLMK